MLRNTLLFSSILSLAFACDASVAIIDASTDASRETGVLDTGVDSGVADSGADTRVNDTAAEASADAPSDATTDVAADVATDVVTTDVAMTDAVATDAARSGPASWTIGARAMCMNAASDPSTCEASGSIFQVGAFGTCGEMELFSLYFASSPAPGTYDVAATASATELASVPTGRVRVLVTLGPSTREFYGQSGTVTVTNTGGRSRATFTGLVIQETGTTTSTPFTGSIECP